MKKKWKTKRDEKLPSLNVLEHAGEQQWWSWMNVCTEDERGY